MNDFFWAYLNTALVIHCDDQDYPLDYRYSITDVTAEALETILADCRDFLEHPVVVAFRKKFLDTDLASLGEDFFLTRNRHNAGFRNGDWPEPWATKLTEIAHPYGKASLYVGDDGWLHVA